MKRACVYFIALFFAVSLDAKSVKQYQNEIEKENKSLHELKKALEEKRTEKEYCLLEEKRIRSEVARIEQELARLAKQKDALRRDINKAQKNLAYSEKALKLADMEKNQWQAVLEKEADLWFRANHGFQKMFTNPVAGKLRLYALSQKKTYRDNAEEKETESKIALERWQNAKATLLNLKKKQEQTARERENIKGEKQGLLKTTIGRRIVAEDEIKKITDSARDLERVIGNLEKKKKQTEAETAARKVFREKKNLLPWPVQGEIITRFGKNKHPELATYVISNGIKIRTAPLAAINAVSGGEVIFSGEFRAYGLMVILDHGGGFYSIYGQLGETSLEEGQKPKAGEAVGRMGNSGEQALYFEIRSAGKPEDPTTWLIHNEISERSSK
ncbi:MAG: hypothetical protein A2219_00265 [Elusimicrobia bacterium RIFOXYA2_FULL_50_26]|nr:MAG: hypothetical protein A2219_00265 [Elusimicrobia bacterium RIFOXYA2_FULL_50_26]OGS22504.1 MAG: hypothetical protein A2314_08385 [Elusimicrobia bacterium RIFOXYB2_FULL_50_12]